VVTFIFVTLCRKFDDKNDLDNEGDKAKELNKYNAENEEVFLVKIKKLDIQIHFLYFCHFLFNRSPIRTNLITVLKVLKILNSTNMNEMKLRKSF
jgi:hypothetical protein